MDPQNKYRGHTDLGHMYVRVWGIHTEATPHTKYPPPHRYSPTTHTTPPYCIDPVDPLFVRINNTHSSHHYHHLNSLDASRLMRLSHSFHEYLVSNQQGPLHLDSPNAVPLTYTEVLENVRR